jgi:hypothetical protein
MMKSYAKRLNHIPFPFGEGLSLTASGGDGAILAAISFVFRLTSAYEDEKHLARRQYRN